MTTRRRFLAATIPTPPDNPPLGERDGDELLALTQVERIAHEADQRRRRVEHDAQVDALATALRNGGAA